MDQDNRKRVFVGLPNCWDIEPEAYESALSCAGARTDIYCKIWRSESSLLPHNFNICLAECINEGGYGYWLLHHSDIGCPRGFLGVMLDEMESHGLDVLHAPVAIKNGSGLTSTALAYSDDEWATVRRLTLKEIATLPPTFDVHAVNATLNTNATHLLPNTGVLLVKLGDWISRFESFNNPCRIEVLPDGKWKPHTTPEDWLFGHWCARNGVKVGGTRSVVTSHIGRASYRSDGLWGAELDTDWVQEVSRGRVRM
jgi:hypothetical protein